MEKLIDINSYPVAQTLDVLLQDKTTKQNIIWATDTYEELGEGFADNVQLDAKALPWRFDLIHPRIRKSQEAQTERTRKKAEVFTPAWLCNQMNNHCDEDWFGRSGVFNTENADHTWTVTEGKIEFPKRKKWQHYVDSRRLEITCGEAPYLVSRYDVSTGELIVPPIRRIGMLDRKLRIVNENTEGYDEWLKWTIRAFEACYGYEYQGDNVLIARINLLLTFTDAYEERWKRQPDEKLLRLMANKIAWNIWQMDGLKDAVPLGKSHEEPHPISDPDLLGDTPKGNADEPNAAPCRIFDWRSKNSLLFKKLKEMWTMGKKLFDYVIGNPPYQETQDATSDKPVYNYLLDAAYDVSEKAEFITPARFLFNAGKTPKSWNEKMLNDPHFKVMKYEKNASNIFANTEIKGGVVITYRDCKADFGAIEHFIPNEILRGIVYKVRRNNYSSLSEYINGTEYFKLSPTLYEDHPEILTMKITVKGKEVPLVSKGHEYDLTSNILDKNPSLFYSEKPDAEIYCRVCGRQNGKRTLMYIRQRYLKPCRGLEGYKIILPESNNNGTFGETLVNPFVGDPDIATTQTFITIGFFAERDEADALLKYISGKFARALLGTLKITQHNKQETWKNVPMQDFTSSSDIDWSKSIHDIDLQLYRKYGLDEKEIEFIESHVKEMA